MTIRYIRLAHEQGLGCGNVRQIELVGDDVSGENRHFKIGRNSHSFLAWLSWYGPTRGLQKLLFRTPSKDWHAGLWNSDLPIAIRYANLIYGMSCPNAVIGHPVH